jgi:hypothetical protein
MKHIDISSLYGYRPRRGSPASRNVPCSDSHDRNLWPKAPTSLVYRRLSTFMMVFFRPTVPRTGC